MGDHISTAKLVGKGALERGCKKNKLIMVILSWTREPLAGVMVVRMIEEYVKLMTGWAGTDENMMSRMAHVAYM